MADIPCANFSPILVGGQSFCGHCGFHSDFHLEIVNISDEEDNQQHHPQQQRQAVDPIIDWEVFLMDEWPVQPPPTHANNAKGNPQPGGWYQSGSRTGSFTAGQVQRMLDMARRLQWTLRGRSRDSSVDDFCTEIGVPRSQFANWLNRNRERYGGRRG